MNFSIILSIGKSLIGTILPHRPYWAAKRADGTWLCELDSVYDLSRAHYRPFDWTLDMVSTGDIKRLTELWLFSPPSRQYPFGQSNKLLLTPGEGSAFQLKVASMEAWGGSGRTLDAMLIGKVTDKESGACECRVWDARLGMMGVWHSNVYEMGSWAPHIAPIHELSHEVLGLDLSSH